MIYKPLKSLLYSRKFLLAAFAVIQAVVLHYADVPPEIWQSIAALVAVLITTIAVEDAAEKRAGYTLPEIENDPPPVPGEAPVTGRAPILTRPLTPEQRRRYQEGIQ